MKLSLRKAAAVQNSINDAIKSLEFKTDIKVNEFQDPESEINRAEGEVLVDIGRRDRLLSTVYEIRKLVSQANSQAGIDSRLGEVAFLEKQVQFYSDLSKKHVRESEAVLKGKLDKIKSMQGEARSRIYGYGDEISTSVFTRAQLDVFRKRVSEFKKSKQRLQDEILELNVRTEITVSAETQSLLTAEGLV